MKTPSPPLSRASVADQFRSQIERAEADGTPRGDMTLRLTFSDASALKRDPNLPLADIHFAEGTMRFLGVRVEQGGVAVSALDRPAAE